MKDSFIESSDLLSLVGQATKRKGDFLSQAEDLAKKVKTPEKLEKKMMVESRILVKALRDKQIRWEEYSRSLIQKTLVSALCGVYLGSKDNNPKKKMGDAWPIIIGDMLPPLVKFLAETAHRIETGKLLLGDKTMDFADPVESEDFDPGEEGEGLDELELEDGVPTAKKEKRRKVIIPLYGSRRLEEAELDVDGSDANEPDGKGKTWPGLFGRVNRYTVSPVYSAVALGVFLTRREQGYKEMRRVAVKDKRTCDDCKNFASLGWQPIGSLPMPGRMCTCYDRCRCRIEYR